MRETCLILVEGNLSLNRWGWNPYLLLLSLLHLPSLGLTLLITVDGWIYQEGFRFMEWAMWFEQAKTQKRTKAFPRTLLTL